MNGPALSIVIPCYNEEGCLTELHRRVSAAARGLVGGDHEIVLVNDGSRDASWAMMQSLAAQDPHLVAVNLSRNHGHQLALTGTHVGCDTAQCGACTVHMNGRAVNRHRAAWALGRRAVRSARYTSTREARPETPRLERLPRIEHRLTRLGVAALVLPPLHRRDHVLHLRQYPQDVRVRVEEEIGAKRRDQVVQDDAVEKAAEAEAEPAAEAKPAKKSKAAADEEAPASEPEQA